MSFWFDQKKRHLIYQILVLIGILGTGFFFYSNTQTHLERQNIASGFGFLDLEAGFEISDTVIEYWSDDSYRKALWVGLLNTFKVAVLGNFLALVLGLLVGLSRLSSNWLLSRLSLSYVELIRNVPLLLQLFFWYAIFSEVFPPIKQAWEIAPHTFLSQRGLVIPVISSWFPFIMDYPKLSGFNFSGGYNISPEFMTLMLGLVIYTSAFIAEIVRAGVLSVDKGQREAARSLGLSATQTMGLVVLPQAMRVIIPPLTSQVLNLVKNSSLAIGIGFPDFVAVANTTMNQTGQAIELVVLIMLVYLCFSISTSVLMNLYNKRLEKRGGMIS
jgi:general L-amino acid transport system permease protein